LHEPTNAAHAAALRSAPQDNQAHTPTSTSDTAVDTIPEGKSSISALPATTKQQSLALAPPSLTCTHTPAFCPSHLQSERSDIVENQAPKNSLQANFVPLHLPASVSVVESRDCNTCKAKSSTSSAVSSRANGPISAVSPAKIEAEDKCKTVRGVPGLSQTLWLNKSWRHVFTSPMPTREFRLVCLGKVKLAFRQRTGKEVMVVDSGATSHMNPHHGSFIKFCQLPPGHYVELADKSKVRALGIGTTLQ
jgi:hypothetical protein